MKYTKIRIKTTIEAVDIIISNLYDIGLDGAQIEDNQPLTALEKEQMFVDVIPDDFGRADDFDEETAYLNFFADENHGNIPELLNQIEAELNSISEYIDIGEASITVSETETLDWINNWKQHFHQFLIDDVLVIPSWETISVKETAKYIINIDPGTAFGTGKHETTQLCIRQLRKYIKEGDKILDIGCGSGILAILSLMFGAKKAYGTDLDPCALEAVEQNKTANNIPSELFEVLIGNIITDERIIDEIGGEASFDIVVANILTEVLVPLSPVANRCLKKNGLFITSGILNMKEKEEQVVTAMKESGMDIVEINYQGEWINVTGRKI